MKIVYETNKASTTRAVSVQVRKEEHFPVSYDIEVISFGKIVNSMTNDDSEAGAITIADLLLDIYWNELQDTLLAH